MKLERTYHVESPVKKHEVSAYIMEDMASRIREAVTDAAWKDELGGLLLKPKPQRPGQGKVTNLPATLLWFTGGSEAFQSIEIGQSAAMAEH